MKIKVKRLEALLKLNIIEGMKNNAEIKKLYDELIQGGYPESLLKSKLQLLKNNFLAEKDLNDILEGVRCLTPSDIKFRKSIIKAEVLGYGN